MKVKERSAELEEEKKKLQDNIDERKSVEEELRDRERRLKEAEQIAHLGHWEFDIVSNRLVWSDEIYRIFDLKPQEFGASYEAFFDLVHPDDREFVDKAYQDSLKNKTKYDIVHRLLLKDGTVKYVHERCRTEYDDEGNPLRSLGTVLDITERQRVSEELERIKWLLTKSINTEPPPHIIEESYEQDYGDLTELNNFGLIKNMVEKDLLVEVTGDYLDLLQSSAAIYEKDGKYALGIFSSGWCRFLDNASRNLCGDKDNAKALNSGEWLCHESCWNAAAKPCIEKGRPVDIECNGGIHLYAVPIIAGGEIVGSMNFGYGDPPQDPQKLQEIAEKYRVSLDELRKKARQYESRPQFIIEIAKNRLLTSAKLIGEIIERRQAEEKQKRLLYDMGERVKELTCMYRVTKSIRIRQTLEEIFNDVVSLIPPGWQYPEITCCRIRFNDKEYTSKVFKETQWKQARDIIVNGQRQGTIEVFYMKECPELYEGPFLKEECRLIDGIAGVLGEAVEHKQAEEKLLASKESLEKSQQIAHLGNWEWDIEADKITWSEELFRIYDIDPLNPLKYEKLMERVHPDDRDYHDKITADWMEKQRGGQFEYRILRSDGSIRFLNVVGEVSCDIHGKPVRMFGIVQDVTKHKLVVDALREEKDKAKNYLDVAGVILVVLNADQTVSLINKKGCEVLGYREEDIIGKNWFDNFLPENIRVKVKSYFAKLIAGEAEEVEYFENPVITKEGLEKTISWHNVLLRNQTGEIFATLSSGEDITERNRAEKKLKDSEERFRVLFEQAAIGVAQISIDTGHYLKINQRFCDIVGYTPEEMLELTFQDITHPEDLQADLDNKQEITEGKIGEFSMEKRYIRKDGSPVWVNLTVSPMWKIGEQPNYYIAVVEEITKRKKAEEELLKKQYFLSKAQEIGKIGTWELDIKKNILLWTDENYRIFGLPQGTELTYETFFSCIHPDDREYVDREWKAAFNKKPYDVEHRLLMKDGSIKWVREKAQLDFDEQGNCLRGTGFTQDITGRKQVEEEVRLLARYPKENPNPILRIEKNGTIQFANEASKPIQDVLGSQEDGSLTEEWKKRIKEIYDSQKSVEIELKHNSRIFSLMVTPFADTDYLYCYGTDITERKHAEDELDRYRRHLEELVDERTEKLTKANQQLETEITKRKETEEYLKLSHRLLEITNQFTSIKPLLQEFSTEIKDFTNCTAIGIRMLDEDDNIPYQTHEGFSETFFESECHISLKEDRCLCSLIALAEFDPQLSFYTNSGSFYTNNVEELWTNIPDEFKQKEDLRHACKESGYQSLALIPIRMADRIIGLIQLVDYEKDRFPLELIETLEQTTISLGSAIQRLEVQENLRLQSEITTNMSEGISLIRAGDGIIVFTNPKFAEMFGYEPDEMVGKHVSIVNAPTDKSPEETAREISASINKNGFWQGEVKNIKKDRTQFWCHASVSLFNHPEHGNVFVTAQQDISESKQAEEALLKSDKEQKIFNRISKIFLTIPDDEMYAEVLKIVLEIVGSKFGIFAYIDENGNLVCPSMTRDVWDKYQIPEKTIIYPPETWAGIWGRCLKEKKILHSNGPFKVPQGHLPMTRVLCIPIIYQDNVIGLFEVANKETDYDKKDIMLLENVVNYLAPVLYERLERSRQEKARKQGEEALIKAKKEWEQTFDTVPDAIMVLDRDHKIVRINKSMANLVGRSPDECIGQLCYNIVHGIDTPPPFCPHKKLMADGCAHTAEVREENLGGDFIISTVPMYDEKKQLTGSVHVAHDITERKQAEEARLSNIRSLEHMDQINEVIREATNIEQMMNNVLKKTLSIFQCDRVWVLFPAAPDAPSFWIPMEHTTPRYPGALVAGKDVPMTPESAEAMRVALEANGPVAYDPESGLVLNDVSKQFSVQSEIDLALYPKIGKPWLFGLHQCSYPRIWTKEDLRLFQDIGNRLADGLSSMLFLEDLRESEERFRTLVQKAGDVIIVLSPDFKVLEFNREAERVYGVKRDMVLGKNYFDLFIPDEEEKRLIITDLEKVFSGQPTKAFENKIRSFDGDKRFLSWNVNRLSNYENYPVVAIASGHDITKRKQMEERLKTKKKEIEDLNLNLGIRVQEELKKSRQKDFIMMHQSRMAAMGEMIGNIAHQWKQPLNALNILLYNIKDLFDSEEKEPELIDNFIEKGTDLVMKMASTIDDFRHFFKPNKEKEKFSINKIITDSLALVDASLIHNNISVISDLQNELAVEGYPNEYSQVILNILNNAKDAIIAKGGGGEIKIETYFENDSAVVKISDNGGGIPEDIIHHVFDPYFTTKKEEKGTGIGLYMSKMIIEEHMDGRIEVQNTAEGAEFKIITPILISYRTSSNSSIIRKQNKSGR